MMRARQISLVMWVGAATFGQTPAGPHFEVASIKLAPSPAELRSQGKAPPRAVTDASQARIYSTLSGLIKRAFRLENYQKLTGPDWINTTWFELNAKLPEGASQNEIPEMLKALLMERLQLRATRQSQLETVYTLTVGKDGPKLKEVPPDTDVNAKWVPAPGQVLVVRSGVLFYSKLNGAIQLDAIKITLPELASALRKEVDLPVIDKTGLQGFYAISIPVPGIWLTNSTGSDPSGGNIFKSVESLGLHLEKAKAEIENLVVEHVEKVPSGN
jgi:uncharacterized protein (TIGR03435 family)